MSDCDPVGVPELAERLGVAATTPHQWKSRGLMPPPDYVVSTTPAWEWCGVLRWAGLNGRIYNPAAVAEYRDRFGEDPVRPRLMLFNDISHYQNQPRRSEGNLSKWWDPPKGSRS